ncbi:MAG: hypothetical protein A3G24_06790 [Betaproteobacteria bacterium RIFCSPLOWO2_12_FULL_62_13]|nr:MAG: hypothetical protein A3G24_06790 [Betaproteobacteria bacterium RIFCSPLOWO2_12_FULL_62_13]
MDERLRKRMLAFYFAGVFNLVLGVYVLIEGPALLGRDTALLLTLFFLGFAAVDFYFPRAMKKKWLEDHARRASGDKPPQVKGEG